MRVGRCTSRSVGLRVGLADAGRDGDLGGGVALVAEEDGDVGVLRVDVLQLARRSHHHLALGGALRLQRAVVCVCVCVCACLAGLRVLDRLVARRQDQTRSERRNVRVERALVRVARQLLLRQLLLLLLRGLVL